MANKKNLPLSDSEDVGNEYLPVAIANLIPLLPGKNAIQAAAAAYAHLKLKYPSIIASTAGGTDDAGDEQEHPAHRQLLDIAHVYCHRRSIYKQESKPNFNVELGKINKAALNLQSILKRAPRSVHFLLDRNFKFAVGDSHSMLHAFEISLEELIAASGKVHEEGPRGARPKAHVRYLALKLLELWEESGNEFKWRFDSAVRKDAELCLEDAELCLEDAEVRLEDAEVRLEDAEVRLEDADSDDEFVSEGVEFVWALMSQIDSKLTKSEVIKALKELSAQRSRTGC